jgi:hypothetical protein
MLILPWGRVSHGRPIGSEMSAGDRALLRKMAALQFAVADYVLGRLTFVAVRLILGDDGGLFLAADIPVGIGL